MLKKLFSFRNTIKLGSIYTIGNIVNRGIPFLLMPYLTRVLPPDEYGLVSLFLSLSVLVTAFMGFSSNSVVSQKYFKIEDDNKMFLISDALKLSFFGLIFLIVVSIPFSKILYRTFGMSRWLLTIILAVSFMNIWFLIVKVLLQVQKKALLYIISINAVTLINLVISILFISAFNMAWRGRIYGFLISATAGFLFSVFYFIKNGFLTRDSIKITRYIKEVFLLGIALVPASVGGWLVSVGDRFILSGYLSNDAVGLYAAAFTLASILDVVATPVGLVWAPVFFEKKAMKKKIADEYTKKCVIIISLGYIFVAILGIIIIPLLTKVFLGPKYQTAITIVPWLIGGLTFRSISGILGYYILHYEKNIFMTINFIISSCIGFCLSFYLISIKGVFGAAQANLFSGALGVVLTLFFIFICIWSEKKNGSSISG